MTSRCIERRERIENLLGSHSQSIPNGEDNVFKIKRFLRKLKYLFESLPSRKISSGMAKAWRAFISDSRISQRNLLRGAAEKHRSGKSVARVCRVLSMIHLPALFDRLIPLSHSFENQTCLKKKTSSAFFSYHLIKFSGHDRGSRHPSTSQQKEEEEL